ncbi:MAG: tyrosine--tRNA ligase [Anaerolineales bacterium]|nr:tyrosine--tRNA ligase [Anaerolineales bacterium]
MAIEQSIDQQVALLMQGIEMGDEKLKEAMGKELRERLEDSQNTGVPLRVYCGYDPTSPDLHIGHTVTMRKLRQFQELGHQAIFVVGSFTALVGDPSDKDKARPRLTKEQVMANAKTYTDQAFKILDREKTEVRFNDRWLSGVTLEQVIEVASNFTVQQFLVRDNFSKRYASNEPIWLHEFFYALLQGYDAAELRADVQLGATEQLFNLLAGRKLQEAMGMKPQVALTVPVLVGTDGHLRMSKSTGNTIGIDEPPEEMYGKVMSIPDSAMSNYFRLVTRWTPDEVAFLEEGLASGDLHPRDVKMRLAREVVEIYHGVEAVEPAEAAFVHLVQEGGQPEDMPEHAYQAGTPLIDAMVDSGLVESKSQARRLVDQNGVRLNGEVVEDPNFNLDFQEAAVLQVGKRRFARLVRAQ